MSEFAEFFDEYKYDDAPYLSDQLLLPNLAMGHSVYLATAFTTSYIFKLVRDLAESDEIEPGLLTLTFFVPGDLKLKAVGLARFKAYLTKYSVDELQVAQFVSDCIQLMDEGNLRVSMAHTNQKAPLVRGCMGVIVSEFEMPEGVQGEYVAFVDAKAGDYNSPIVPLKSWVDDDYFVAQELLQKVSLVVNGSQKNTWLVTGDEAYSWFEYLEEWYVENPPKMVEELEDSSSEADASDEFELDDSTGDLGEIDADILEYLQSHEDFEEDASYGWFEDEDSPYEFKVTPQFTSYTSIDESQLHRGHVPPLPRQLQGLYAYVGAVCPTCHEVFYREEGCPSIDWD